MNMATRVQILDEIVYIFQSDNSLGKGMNPTILPLAMGEIVGQTKVFNLVVATS